MIGNEMQLKVRPLKEKKSPNEYMKEGNGKHETIELRQYLAQI